MVAGCRDHFVLYLLVQINISKSFGLTVHTCLSVQPGLGFDSAQMPGGLFFCSRMVMCVDLKVKYCRRMQQQSQVRISVKVMGSKITRGLNTITQSCNSSGLGRRAPVAQRKFC